MKLYKYRSLEHMDHALDIILNERLYCPEYTNLNDPFEGLFTRFVPVPVTTDSGESVTVNNNLVTTAQLEPADVSQLMLESLHTRVCSLSDDLHDVRLWSHYADGHRGIAIEIDFTDHVGDVNQVGYAKTLPSVLGGLMELGTSPRDILTKKTNHWDYESEYRIINDDEYYYVNGMVKAIYCGINISETHKNILQSIAIPYHIEMYETELDIESIQIVQTASLHTTSS